MCKQILHHYLQMYAYVLTLLPYITSSQWYNGCQWQLQDMAEGPLQVTFTPVPEQTG